MKDIADRIAVKVTESKALDQSRNWTNQETMHGMGRVAAHVPLANDAKYE